MTESLELAVLSDVSTRLESEGFDYMLTGSVAMNYYAQPRMTRDIDIVVSITEGDAGRIVDMFDGDYYVSDEAVLDAAKKRSMFNIVHLDSVVKVDLIVLRESEYRQLELIDVNRSRSAENLNPFLEIGAPDRIDSGLRPSPLRGALRASKIAPRFCRTCDPCLRSTPFCL
jgi:hypothetical protein